MRLFFGVYSNRILILVFFHFSIIDNCNANMNFNASLRDYSQQQEHINTTNIKTLQKEDFAKYSHFAPMRNVAQYREIQDNVLSGSAYSHGATHHEIPAAYGVHDFEEAHYGHLGHGHYNHIGPSFDHHGGSYEHIEPGLVHHGGFEHHGHGHHLGYGYGHGHAGHHHKHFDHALSAKAILLPVAGLAILGAAAALVSNPILLQLGVVSGRKRRDTTGLGDEQLDTTNWISKPDFRSQPEIANRKDRGAALGNGRIQKASLDKKNGLNKKALLGLPIRQSTIEPVTLGAQHYDSSSDVNFVPVPLKFRKGYRHVP